MFKMSLEGVPRLSSREAEEFWVRVGNRNPPRLAFVEERGVG